MKQELAKLSFDLLKILFAGAMLGTIIRKELPSSYEVMGVGVLMLVFLIAGLSLLRKK